MNWVTPGNRGKPSPEQLLIVPRFSLQRLSARGLIQLDRVIPADSFQTFSIIEGEVLIPIVFAGEEDAKVSHCIPHRCKMEGLVVKNHAIKIEDYRFQHRYPGEIITYVIPDSRFQKNLWTPNLLALFQCVSRNLESEIIRIREYQRSEAIAGEIPEQSPRGCAVLAPW